MQAFGSPAVFGSHLSCSHCHLGWNKEAQSLSHRQVAVGSNGSRPFADPSAWHGGRHLSVQGETSRAGFPSRGAGAASRA